MAPSPRPVAIRRYPNQRLYRPDAARYVGLDELAAMVEDDEDFLVRDANTGEDVTAAVLKRVISERARHG